MKRKGKLISILQLALMFITLFSPVSKTVEAEITELHEGAVYRTGDSIQLSEDKWVLVDDSAFSVRKLVKAGTYEVGEIYCPEVLIGENHPWYVDDLFEVVGEDYKADLSIGYYDPNKSDDEITVTGFRCAGGTGGDESDAFRFELIYENRPAVTKYPLWVGGKQLTSKYLSNETEGWSYDPETSTLTLNNADIRKGYQYYEFASDAIAGIYAGEGLELTVKLIGDNRIGSDEIYGAMGARNSLTITGEGKLNACGIKWGIASPYLTIDGTEVTANGSQQGLDSSSLLLISDSVVNVTASELYGLYLRGDLMITDSTVDISAGSTGILQESGEKITISGQSTVTVKMTEEDGIAVLSDYEILLDGVEIVRPERGIIGAFYTSLKWNSVILEKDGKTAARDVVIKNAGYSIVSGGDAAYTSGSGEDHSITVKRESNDQSCFEHFEKSQKGVEIDGKVLVKDTDYTAAAGSTIITLKAAALNRLSEGDHKITVNFDDGKAETSLTIKAAPAPTPDPTPVTPYQIPKTGVE